MLHKEYDPPSIHCDSCPDSIDFNDAEKNGWSTKTTVFSMKAIVEHFCPKCTSIFRGKPLPDPSIEEIREALKFARNAVYDYKWDPRDYTDNHSKRHSETASHWHVMNWIVANDIKNR